MSAGSSAIASVSCRLQELRGKLANNPDYARSLLAVYAAAGLNVVVQLVMVPLYLTHLGKETFGVLMVILATVNYLAVGITWASAGSQRILGEMSARGERERLDECYSFAKAISLAYAGGIAALAIAATALWRAVATGGGGLSPDALLAAVAAAAAYFVALYDFNVDRVTLIAMAQQARANWLAAVSQAVFAACAIPALLAGGGLYAVMLSLLAGMLTARLLSWRALRRLGVTWRWPDAAARAALFHRLTGSMGRGYALYGVLLLSLLQGDTLIVGWLGGATMVAEFVLVWKIADVVTQMLWRIPEALQPYVVQIDALGGNDRLRRIHRDGQRWMTVAAAIAGLGFALLGPTIVKLWVGAENAPDSRLAFVLAGGAIFWLASARLNAVMAYSLLRLRDLNFVAGIELAGRGLALLLLLPAFGILAPLMAVNGVYAVGVWYLYRRLARRMFSTADNPVSDQRESA